MSFWCVARTDLKQLIQARDFWIPMLALIAVLGIYPNLVFKLSDPAVTHIVNGMSKVI